MKTLMKLFKRKAKLPGLRNPAKDWIRILMTFGIVGVVICIAGIFLFYGIETGILFAPETKIPDQSQVFDRNAINTVGTFYTEKEKQLETLKTTAPVLVDPSL